MRLGQVIAAIIGAFVIFFAIRIWSSPTDNVLLIIGMAGAVIGVSTAFFIANSFKQYLSNDLILKASLLGVALAYLGCIIAIYIIKHRTMISIEEGTDLSSILGELTGGALASWAIWGGGIALLIYAIRGPRQQGRSSFHDTGESLTANP